MVAVRVVGFTTTMLVNGLVDEVPGKLCTAVAPVKLVPVIVTVVVGDPVGI
jgi:hypothetical protein